MKKLLAAVAFVLAQTSFAPAATMTFDHYDFATADFLSRTYTESGITAKGNGLVIESFARGGGTSMYLADGGWGGPTSLAFTMGSLFDAVSFDLTPGIFDYFVTNTLSGASARGSFVNVRVQGFDANGLVAQTIFDMGSGVGAATTYALGAAFKNLTSLVIGFGPTPGFTTPTPVGTNLVGQCTNVPCSRYRLDNVNLAPVPLPATLSLMMVALAGIGVAARRRRATVTI
jgi:hypothetical protein